MIALSGYGTRPQSTASTVSLTMEGESSFCPLWKTTWILTDLSNIAKRFLCSHEEEFQTFRNIEIYRKSATETRFLSHLRDTEPSLCMMRQRGNLIQLAQKRRLNLLLAIIKKQTNQYLITVARMSTFIGVRFHKNSEIKTPFNEDGYKAHLYFQKYRLFAKKTAKEIRMLASTLEKPA